MDLNKPTHFFQAEEIDDVITYKVLALALLLVTL